MAAIEEPSGTALPEAPQPPTVAEEFASWLAKKKIDAAQLQAAKPTVYAAWFQGFQAMHPDSLLMLIKFEINQVRRELLGLASGRTEN